MVEPGVPSTETDALAVLASVEGVGPITIERLVARLGSAVEVLRAARDPDGERQLLTAARHPEDGRSVLVGEAAREIVRAAGTAESFLDALRRRGIRPIAIADASYPSRLRAIEQPPAVLFVDGDLVALGTGPAVAIVGTRRPTDAGRLTAARIAAAVTRAGATVISGLAVGIDGSAHAAVVAEGGRTVAVIGGGHDRLFPRVHGRLARAIVGSGGAVVSEHAPATRPTRGTFPRRNRIISGLADAVVVIEAGASSGALLTASWALEQGREVFAVPGSIDAPASAGCNGFIREFPGLVRIVSGIPQLLDDLRLPALAALSPRAASRKDGPASTVAPPSIDATLAVLDPLDRQIALAILGGAATVDELVAIASAPVAATLAALTRLETAGLVESVGGRSRPTPRMGGVGRVEGAKGTVASTDGQVLSSARP